MYIATFILRASCAAAEFICRGTGAAQHDPLIMCSSRVDSDLKFILLQYLHLISLALCGCMTWGASMHASMFMDGYLRFRRWCSCHFSFGALTSGAIVHLSLLVPLPICGYSNLRVHVLSPVVLLVL
jgi:hypothetical protein